MAKRIYRQYKSPPNESCKQGVPLFIAPEEDETPCLITVTLWMGTCWEQSIEKLSLFLPCGHHFRRAQTDGRFFTSRTHMLLLTLGFIGIHPVE